MTNQEWELLYYQTAEGKIPFVLWFDGLKNEDTKSLILARLARLRIGQFGKCVPVGSGVFELKIYDGPGYRIYFGIAGRRIILLILGGDKSTQDWDIRRVKSYWFDYKRRTS